MWGSFLARTRGPDVLVLLQITADSNLKYQLSLSVRWERKGRQKEEAVGEENTLAL